MQLTRIVLHARLKSGELLHPAGSGGDFWARIAVSLYCLQTLLSTGMSVFGKLASQDGIGFFELTFFRNLATLLLTIPVLVAGHVNPLQHKLDKAFWLLCLRGLLGFASLSTWYLSLSLMPLSDALAISFLSPLLVAALAPLLLKEPSPPGLAWTLPLSCMGMLLVAQPTWIFGSSASAEGPSALALCVGAVQALLSTGSKLIMRSLSHYHEPLSEIIAHMSFVSCCGAALGILIMPGAMTLPQRPQTWGWLVGLCLLGYFVQVCFTAAMQHVTAAKAGVLDYVSLIWTLAADALIFSHLPSTLSLAGAAVIVASSCASLLLGQRAGAAKAVAGGDGAGGAAAAAAQLTAAEARVVQLRKLVHYDSLRSARKLERALQALDGRGAPDAETQGLLGGVESSAPSWAVQPAALSPRAAAAAPAAAAGPAAVPAQPAAAAAEEEEWKLQASTELAEVVEVSGAEDQRPGPRRTSSEKEAALRRAGR